VSSPDDAGDKTAQVFMTEGLPQVFAEPADEPKVITTELPVAPPVRDSAGSQLRPNWVFCANTSTKTEGSKEARNRRSASPVLRGSVTLRCGWTSLRTPRVAGTRVLVQAGRSRGPGACRL
jgi:hypothetical protein